MNANFNEQLFEPITVSKRMWLKKHDFYWVIDGGHRLEVANLRTLKEVPVRILECNSIQEEATLFTLLNSQRVAVGRSHKHRAMVVAGDNLALSIEDSLNSIGFKMIQERGDSLTLLKPVACIYDIWSRGETSDFAHPAIQESDRLSGERLLKATILLSHSVWGSKTNWNNNNTLKALGIFLETFWDQLYDRDTFVDVIQAMEETTPDDLHAKAARKSSNANNSYERAQAFAKIYNQTHGRKIRVHLLDNE